ncbi:hypothetical protein Droror1_Dr00008834 [Drosera rotundifolia]
MGASIFPRGLAGVFYIIQCKCKEKINSKKAGMEVEPKWESKPGIGAAASVPNEWIDRRRDLRIAQSLFPKSHNSRAIISSVLKLAGHGTLERELAGHQHLRDAKGNPNSRSILCIKRDDRNPKLLCNINEESDDPINDHTSELRPPVANQASIRQHLLQDRFCCVIHPFHELTKSLFEQGHVVFIKDIADDR